MSLLAPAVGDSTNLLLKKLVTATQSISGGGGPIGPADGAVVYDAVQSLTAGQQAQALKNLGSGLLPFGPETITITANAGTVAAGIGYGSATNSAATALTMSAMGTLNDMVTRAMTNSSGTTAYVWTIKNFGGATIETVTVPASSTVTRQWQSTGATWVAVGGAATINDLSANATPASTQVVETVNPTTGVGTKSTLAQVVANSFGTTYSTATLLALTAPQSAALQQAVCTDCMTLRGTGGLVFWDGTNWRLANGVLATTVWQTFVKSVSDSLGTPINTRYVCAGIKNTFQNDGQTLYQQNSGAGGSTGNISSAGYAQWLLFDTVTSATAGSELFVTNFHYLDASVVGNYERLTVYFSALSTSGEEYNFRTGVDWYQNFAITDKFVGFVYDRGNILGSFNAGNSAHWICATRSGGVNQVTVTAVTPSISAAAPDTLEVFYSPTAATFYINGVLVATHDSSHMPSGQVASCAVLNKSNGTTSRQAYLTGQAEVLRLQ